MVIPVSPHGQFRVPKFVEQLFVLARVPPVHVLLPRLIHDLRGNSQRQWGGGSLCQICDNVTLRPEKKTARTSI